MGEPLFSGFFFFMWFRSEMMLIWFETDGKMFLVGGFDLEVVDNPSLRDGFE